MPEQLNAANDTTTNSLVHIHCIAHRLKLACLDAMKQNKYLEHVMDNANFLFSFVHAFFLRSDKLQVLQTALGWCYSGYDRRRQLMKE